jgi:NAD(P)-dependent dehydrogenase (short-subunit alcohol dehydrogenase family)
VGRSRAVEALLSVIPVPAEHVKDMAEPSGLLAGRVACITGAAHGIGRAVAEKFFAHGASVVLADIDGAGAEQVAAQLRLGSDRAISCVLDVADEAAIEHAAERTLQQFGRIDCVVANAGILHLAHVVDMALADWRRVIDVNLTGAFLTCRGFARRMIEQRQGGRIILTSSLFGRRGGAENGAYSASKFGMIGLMESLAAELAPHGILVNAVCPGQVDTEMMQQMFVDRARLTTQTPEAVQRALESRIPLRRMARIDEIADVFLFLASGLNGYVTGQSIVVDGGWQVA